MILVNLVIGMGLAASAGCAMLADKGMLRGSCVLWSMTFMRAAFVSVQDSTGYVDLGLWLLFGWPVCLIYCGLCRAAWVGVRSIIRRFRRRQEGLCRAFSPR
jgi:hypothetical protein